MNAMRTSDFSNDEEKKEVLHALLEESEQAYGHNRIVKQHHNPQLSMLDQYYYVKDLAVTKSSTNVNTFKSKISTDLSAKSLSKGLEINVKEEFKGLCNAKARLKVATDGKKKIQRLIDQAAELLSKSSHKDDEELKEPKTVYENVTQYLGAFKIQLNDWTRNIEGIKNEKDVKDITEEINAGIQVADGHVTGLNKLISSLRVKK